MREHGQHIVDGGPIPTKGCLIHGKSREIHHICRILSINNMIWDFPAEGSSATVKGCEKILHHFVGSLNLICPHSLDEKGILLHHLGCIKPCKSWDKLPTSTGDGRISFINGMTTWGDLGMSLLISKLPGHLAWIY